MLHNYLFLKENLIFRIVLTTVAKLSYKLGWRVHLIMTALDAWVQRYKNYSESEIKNAKFCRV